MAPTAAQQRKRVREALDARRAELLDLDEQLDACLASAAEPVPVGAEQVHRIASREEEMLLRDKVRVTERAVLELVRSEDFLPRKRALPQEMTDAKAAEETRRREKEARRNRSYKRKSVASAAAAFTDDYVDMTVTEKRKTVAELHGKRKALRQQALREALIRGGGDVVDAAAAAELQQEHFASVTIHNVNELLLDRLHDMQKNEADPSGHAPDDRVSLPWDEDEDDWAYDVRALIPAIGSDCAEIYQDAALEMLWSRLGRKYGRVVVGADDARLLTSCEAKLKYKERPKARKNGKPATVRERDKLRCALCGNDVWKAYVESFDPAGTAFRAHLACAFFFVNSAKDGDGAEGDDVEGDDTEGDGDAEGL